MPTQKSSLNVNGKEIPVSCSNASLVNNGGDGGNLVEKALESRPVQEWVQNMEHTIKKSDGSMILNSIEVQSVDMFGSR
jgi:hypothetical protein